MIVPENQRSTVRVRSSSVATRHHVLLAGVAAASVLVMALVGQWLLGQRRLALLGAAAFVFSIIFSLLPPLAVGRVSLAPSRLSGNANADRPLIRGAAWRWLLGLVAVLLAARSYHLFGGNRLLPGFWFWAGAIVYFLLATATRPERPRTWLAERWRRLDRRMVLLLLAITLLGAFFRLYRLDSVPLEMTSDHAEKLLDVYDVLNGHRPVFFPRNTGREAFQFYLTAGLIRFTPLELGHLALKVGTAIFGIITVPFTYLLGRELYGRPAGLLAAFFLAVSHWHVAITRVGLRFPFTAAFATPALYFLFRALRFNRRNDWLAAGVLLGLGLHTYTPMRIVPILFALLVLLKAATDLLARRRKNAAPGSDAAGGWQRSFWINSLLAAGAALLFFLPLLRYMQEKPLMFWYRAASRAGDGSVLIEQANTFWKNTVNALLMFNYVGDVVPANTIPGAPALGLVAGALFPLGCAYLMWRMSRYRERRAAYVLLSFFVLLLPSILSLAFPQENPSVVRTGGAAPFVMIIVALPLVAAGQRLRRLSVNPRAVLLALGLAILLSLAVADNFHWYFVEYDASVRASLWNASEMGREVRRFVEDGGAFENAYHVAYPHWVDTRNVAITAGNITWRNALLDLEQIAAHAGEPGRKLYLLHPSHRAAVKMLQATYPGGMMRRYESERPGKDFLLYVVPERPAPSASD
ncbi:MAG: glycosyltransferase family 39 protein [Chloroflexota bacterium]